MRAGALALVAALVAAAATTASARPLALPCTATVTRAAGSARLAVAVVCPTPLVAIVRLDFPPGVAIGDEAPFPGGICSLRGPRTWFCVFLAGIPVNRRLAGAVTLARPPRAARQRVRVTFEVSRSVGQGEIVLGPNAAQATNAYY